MTDACVTDDAGPPFCVTQNPQVRGVHDADDAGDAEIPTSDTHAPDAPLAAPRRPLMSTAVRQRRVPKDELVPLPDVLEEIGITRATWYRWRDRGLTPDARRTPTGRICVRRSVLDAFKEELDAA